MPLILQTHCPIGATSSADRIGYVLESPADTFPALAVNGPISDEELQSLIDGLIPAKEHLK